MKSILLIVIASCFFQWHATAGVRLEEVPEKGLQPDVAVAADGTVHVVYLHGEARASEVRYSWRKPGEAWQAGVTVNSIPGSAIAIGSIRGPQLALGEKNKVHVLWNGAVPAGQPASTPASLWYAHSSNDGATFEAQQNLMSDTTALDGGASIAADGGKNVFVVWHGKPAGAGDGEGSRLVFVRSSKDSGLTFGKAEAANAASAGVCPCCSLKAMATPDGKLGILFRNATTSGSRDMSFLSKNVDGWMPARTIEPWEVKACPMSSNALAFRGKQWLGAWETAGKIRAGWLAKATIDQAITVASSAAKHPVIAISSQGNILIAWVEGTGWNRGGAVAWQEFDPQLKPLGPPGRASGVPVWGRVAAYAEPQGSFVILR